MRFPEFFESGAAAVPASEGDWVPVNPGPGLAPWISDPFDPGEDDRITVIETEGDAATGGPPFDVESRDWGESGYEGSGADAIACYIPWHSSPPNWGIYFFEGPLFAFARQIASAAGESANAIAPIVLRQVLFHELAHFRFEVVGTELEDAIGRPLYLDYGRYRFGIPVGDLSGPVEESFATWREVRYARGKLQRFLQPKPPRYLAAVETLASASPPGYRDWRQAASEQKQEHVVAAIASLIADRSISTGGWGNWLTEENYRSVPRRWVGDPRLLPAVKALEKSTGPVTITKFRRWLRDHGIEPRPTKSRSQGSHYEFEYGGRKDGYGTSKGSDEMYFKDVKRLAKFFDYPSVVDFQTAVRERRRLTS